MFIYILILFLVLCSLFFKRNLFTFSILFFVLFLLSSFRALSVGGDTIIYKDFFENPAVGLVNVKSTEWGWYLLNVLVYELTGNYRFFLIITSFLVLFPLFLVAYRYTKKPHWVIALYVLLYFYLFSFCFIRQLIAISFLLLAYVLYAEKKSFKSSFFLILLAMTFHASSGLAFVVYFLNRIQFNSLFAAILMILSYFVGRMNFIPYCLNLSGISQLNNYDVVGDVRFTITGFLLTIYLAFLLFIVDAKSFYLKILTIGVLLLNLFAFNTNMSRICWSFLIIQILFFANISLKVKYQKYTLLIQFSFLLYAILNYLQFVIADQGKILPYDFSIE